MSRQDRPQKVISTGVPEQPRELRFGSCAGHPHSDWWCSHNAAEVEAAKRICGSCPVLGICRSWALSLRPVDDQVTILAAMSPAERAAVRAQRARQRAWQTRKRNAAA